MGYYLFQGQMSLF